MNPEAFIDGDVDFCGVVFKLKKMKKFNFILVESLAGVIQCISGPQFECREGESVRIQGVVKKSRVEDQFVKHKNIEIHVQHLVILSSPSETMPFDITKSELNIHNDVLFDLRPISLRHQKEKAIFVIQNELVEGLRAAFRKRMCHELRTPKIVQEGAEGGANIFELNYFGRSAYLTQSPQFYKEFGVGIFQRVFEIAPVFRAEKHNTNRHLNEYISIDVELGFIEHFEELMKFEMACLKEAFENLREKCTFELELLHVELPNISQVPCLKFCEAKEIYFHETGNDEKKENDLSPSEEKFLCEWAMKNHNSEFVFVTHFPSEKRPFYAMDSHENPSETLSFDLLFRGVEITTGGQRIHSESELIKKMQARGMRIESFEFFTRAHKFGLPPHGGFGLGLERLTQKLLALESVKRACLYPRDISRLSP
ncbi:MAG: aspartate--tRNA(Asn) ligase [Bacteriovoracaceae bacterium]